MLQPLPAGKKSPETIAVPNRKNRANGTPCDPVTVIIQRDFTLIARLEAEDFGGREFGFVYRLVRRGEGLRPFQIKIVSCALRDSSLVDNRLVGQQML
jgi:hypothetical protein